MKLVPVGSFIDSLKLGADELSSRGAQSSITGWKVKLEKF